MFGGTIGVVRKFKVHVSNGAVRWLDFSTDVAETLLRSSRTGYFGHHATLHCGRNLPVEAMIREAFSTSLQIIKVPMYHDIL
jgi:hypothetical protein